MKQEIVIGVSIIAMLALLLAIKTWLHHLLKFKMDESAIVNYLEASGGSTVFHTTSTISTATNLKPERVSQVCSRSKPIARNDTEEESWCLRRSEGG